jgi:hypothetical protein
MPRERDNASDPIHHPTHRHTAITQDREIRVIGTYRMRQGRYTAPFALEVDGEDRTAVLGPGDGRGARQPQP